MLCGGSRWLLVRGVWVCGWIRVLGGGGGGGGGWGGVGGGGGAILHYSDRKILRRGEEGIFLSHDARTNKFFE